MSVLVGVRTTIADRVEPLNFTRKEEGTYTSKGASKTKMRAYTRLLVAKISLKHNVGFIGKELRVAVCHLHFQVANNNPGFKKKNIDFWPWLAAEIKKSMEYMYSWGISTCPCSEWCQNSVVTGFKPL